MWNPAFNKYEEESRRAVKEAHRNSFSGEFPLQKPATLPEIEMTVQKRQTPKLKEAGSMDATHYVKTNGGGNLVGIRPVQLRKQPKPKARNPNKREMSFEENLQICLKRRWTRLLQGFSLMIAEFQRLLA
ncbi:hypothetical protein AMTR_s00105p00157120 [Amborella trichopoda]|uniref:Uncharacterized protein n=1 Tax=Amborella trichopoda TaxID=13333 RepID=W1NXM1_AMBTC|nr:hypothetical protein AMTR_s00105p00157120 [Amborella trichopoda]